MQDIYNLTLNMDSFVIYSTGMHFKPQAFYDV